VKKLFNSIAVAALLGAAPLMTACADRTGDTATDVQARVNDNLKTANLDDVKADWKADEKALHLSGEVESAADKARAEELAQQVVGTSGRVVNEVTVEGTNADEVDDRIEKELDRVFKEDDEWDMDGLDLTFDAKAGVVTITGDAPTQAAKDKVGERVRAVSGVKDVVNDLEVKPARTSANARTPRAKG
jgi:osmotically-inducible protein OsmY